MQERDCELSAPTKLMMVLNHAHRSGICSIQKTLYKHYTHWGHRSGVLTPISPTRLTGFPWRAATTPNPQPGLCGHLSTAALQCFIQHQLWSWGGWDSWISSSSEGSQMCTGTQLQVQHPKRSLSSPPTGCYELTQPSQLASLLFSTGSHHLHQYHHKELR